MNRADLRNPYPSFSCAPVAQRVTVRAVPSRVPAILRSVAALAALAAALAWLLP